MRKIKEIYHQLRRKLAKLWLDVNLQLTIVGVAGSYGKTTTTCAITKVLSTQLSVNQTDINLDTNFNLPITILKTKMWNEVLVLEYGIDHLGEMDNHLNLVRPKIAVLTGITPVHAEKGLLNSIENIIAEKTKLVKAVPKDGLAIFNYDDVRVRKIGQDFKGNKIFYGTNPRADVWADQVKVTLGGTEFKIHDGKEDFLIKTGLLGCPAVYACLTAYVVGKRQGIKPDKILYALAGLKPLDGRLSIEPGPLQTILVNDVKRSNPASAVAGLKTLARLPGRKVAVLGEMGELGNFAEKMHREVGIQAAKLKIDILVGVGPLTRFMIEEAQKQGMTNDQLFWTKDVKGTALVLKKVLKPKDLLYLKASLLRHLERVVFLLENKKVICSETVCRHYASCATCSRLVK